jgi:hypothetical protein
MKDFLIVLGSGEVEGEILKQRPLLQSLSAFEDFYSFLFSGVLFVDAEGVEFEFSLNINFCNTRTGLS